jgi:hypothetical protein
VTFGDPQWLRQRYLTERAEVADIAAELGLKTVSAVYRRLSAAGIDRRGKADARAVQQVDADWLATRRGGGMSWPAIAREAGMDHSSLIWQAAGLGLYVLPDDETRRRAALAAERYRAGETLRSLAARFGTDRRQVTLWLRVMGVPVRGPGRRRT